MFLPSGSQRGGSWGEYALLIPIVVFIVIAGAGIIHSLIAGPEALDQLLAGLNESVRLFLCQTLVGLCTSLCR